MQSTLEHVTRFSIRYIFHCNVLSMCLLLGALPFILYDRTIAGDADANQPQPTNAATEVKAPNTLTEAEIKAGWILLFDGKTTDGWRNFRQRGISNHWKVIDGVLTQSDKRAGDIITYDRFGAFELLLEYKIEKGANSGVRFHVVETEKTPGHSSPEVQIIDNESLAKTGRGNPQFSGWLYGLYGSKVDATRPLGQWNTVRLLVTPERCWTEINGVKYYEFVIGDDDWNERVANSKFQAYPAFGKSGIGHICLQDHGGKVSFRNIKIRPISSTPNRNEAD